MYTYTNINCIVILSLNENIWKLSARLDHLPMQVSFNVCQRKLQDISRFCIWKSMSLVFWKRLEFVIKILHMHIITNITWSIAIRISKKQKNVITWHSSSFIMNFIVTYIENFWEKNREKFSDVLLWKWVCKTVVFFWVIEYVYVTNVQSYLLYIVECSWFGVVYFVLPVCHE